MRVNFARAGRSGMAMLGAVLLGLLAQPAGAAEFQLATDLHSGETGSFVTANVEEDGAGGLVFEIHLDEASFEEHGHLKKLYFNLQTDVTGLMLHSTDAVHHPYRLIDRRNRDRKFDFKVYFGHAHHRRCSDDDDNMDVVTFTISADQWLAIDDLLIPVTTHNGHEVQMAAMVKEGRSERSWRWWRRPHSDHSIRMFGGSMVEEPEPDPDDDDGGDDGMPDFCPFPLYDLLTGELISCF